MPWFHQAKKAQIWTKFLITDIFDNYWYESNVDSSTSLFVHLWGASKEPDSKNWIMSHKVILLELESSLQNKTNYTKKTTNPATYILTSPIWRQIPQLTIIPGGFCTLKVVSYTQGCIKGWIYIRQSTRNQTN